MNNSVSKPLIITSLIGVLVGAGFGAMGGSPSVCGVIVTLSLLLLATGIRYTQHFANMSYTCFIFAAVSASMFFPQFFTHVGDFKLSQLVTPLLMVIMFGMGCTMSLKDFSEVAKAPRAVLIGLICQFTLMPIIGVTLALSTGLPPEVAAGIVLIGCSPGGLASNVMAYISGANLALSLTLTSVSTLLAPLMTPLLMGLLADQFVEIDSVAMLISILKMVILPIVAGVVVNHFFKRNVKLINKVMPLVSMAGIAMIITIITAAGRDSLLTIGFTIVAAAVVHNTAGYLLGYGLAKWSGLDERSARAISFEVGMQNGGLASGLAIAMGKGATMGLAPAVFGPFMNISGSALAAWWRKKEEAADSSTTEAQLKELKQPE